MVNGKWLMVKRNVGKFVLGSLVIISLLVILLAVFHLLPSFWNWAVNFGVFILPRSQGQIQLPEVGTLISAIFPFTIFIPLFIKSKFKYMSLLLWAIAGGLGAYPRFEYFHFLPAIPFLAITSAIFFTNLDWKNMIARTFTILYLVVCFGLFGGFFMRNFNEGTRFYEKEVQDLVLYVKTNTNSGDKIFVINWWDNIYALTETMPTTKPWVPQLSWYQEISGIQEAEVADLEKTKTKIVLMQGFSESGLASYKPQKIYDYIMLNYDVKEKVDGIEIFVPKK
jgi:hypothetical protein